MRARLGIALAAAVSGCSGQGAGEVGESLSLKCQGREKIVTERQGVESAPREGTLTTIIFRWTEANNSLVTERTGADPVAFCTGESQEECSVAVENDRLIASNFDLMPGKIPDAVISFAEKIDLDLIALNGSAMLMNSSVSLTDEAAHVDFKATVKIPLECVRLN